MNMKLIRFGVSLPENLSKRFDALIKGKKYPNRSEAIRDLIRKSLVEEEIEADAYVVGVLNLLYDHHKRELQDKLTLFQHDNHEMFISTTHVHLDHDNCLEVILLRGRAGEIKRLAEQMIAVIGIKHGQVFLTSTGKDLS
ncbi:MAG: nickel-responsive transcriptional regulator NikR [Calditrichia bacterium]|nr:nickel-responsive transcriptional regulator NikR [Calditrichia bacterium]